VIGIVRPYGAVSSMISCPLQDTVVDFWSMVYDTDSTVVAMLKSVDEVCICPFTCISFMVIQLNQTKVSRYSQGPEQRIILRNK
jgi:protein tyrosine phosphatase